MTRCPTCGHDPDALTPREAEVSKLVAEGYKNAEVGDQLGLTEKTVKSYLCVIYVKLGVRNRVELSRAVEFLADGTVRRRYDGPPRSVLTP